MEPKRNQGCQIRKTDKNGIKIRITGQGNDENRQKNEKINVNQNIIPDEKDIRSIIDYEKIITKIKKLTKSTQYNFLESLAEDSFKEIFEDKRINSVKIKIEKPEAIKNADSVGVEVFKSRSDYEGS